MSVARLSDLRFLGVGRSSGAHPRTPPHDPASQVAPFSRSHELDAVERVLVDAIDNQIDPLIQTIPGVEDRRTLKVVRTNRII